MTAALIVVGIVLACVFFPRLVAGLAGVGCLVAAVVMVIGALVFLWLIVSALIGKHP